MDDNPKNFVKALRSIYNENDLYEIISSGIKVTDHNHSIQETINFSKEELIQIRNNLKTFIELNDELTDVVDLEHLYFLLDELNSIRAVLKDFAVSKRIEKEIRELKLKVPTYIERKQTEQNYDLNSRIANLEKNCPECTSGHNMVIRQGGINSYFWGCSRFPGCFSTKQISNSDWNYLFPDDHMSHRTVVKSNSTDRPMKPLPQDVSTQNTAKESNKQSESTRGLEKFVKKVVRYHTKNPDIEPCYNSEDRSVPETISPDEITDSRNYISIGALGKSYGIGDSFLFEYFTILGWVARINKKRRLTKIGLHKGGRYKTLNDEDFWIVFNKNLFLDPQVFIKEYETSGYQRSDLNIEEEDALMPNHTSLSLNEKFPTPSVEKTKPCIKKTNQMEFAEIIEILTSLANCINLNNGQCLENSSPYHSDRIVKALCTAIRYLEKHSESEFNLIEEEKLINVNKKNGGKKKLQVPDLDDKKQRIKEQSDILHPVPDNHDICRRLYKGEKPIKIMQDLKYDYPEYLIFVQNGFFWEVYEDDAQVCSQIFGWRVASHSSSANFTGVPVNAKKFKERLEEEGKSYILVAQTQFPSESGCIERVPIELFSAHEFKQE